MASKESRSLAQKVVEWALEKKAEDIVLLDLAGISDVTDYFLLMSGSSTIQIQAITDAIVDRVNGTDREPLHMEGREPGRWVLIDFVDLVVHIMMPEARGFYSLERLWGDAPLTRFDESGQAVHASTGSGE